MNVLRIVPRENPDGGAHLTQGTQVLMPDGTPVPGVTGIVLRADVNDIWRAEIHCNVAVTDLSALAIVHAPLPKPRWSFWFNPLNWIEAR